MEGDAPAPLELRSEVWRALCHGLRRAAELWAREYTPAMIKPSQEARTALAVLALVAAFEIFRPAPAAMQPSMTSLMRDVVAELRGIKQELARIERKMR